jgi:hypothetical protein
MSTPPGPRTVGDDVEAHDVEWRGGGDAGGQYDGERCSVGADSTAGSGAGACSSSFPATHPSQPRVEDRVVVVITGAA